MNVMTPDQSSWPARIYYDGACPICRASANTLRARDVHHRLELIDIAAETFDASAEGLTLDQVRRAMYARLADGRLVSGVDAVLVAADALPSLRLLRWLGRLPGLRAAARPAYRWLARHRYAVLTGACPRGRGPGNPRCA